MTKIDAHQHFWQFDPARDAWIDDSMEMIRRDFMPQDLAPILKSHGITGCVAVQADQSVSETIFLLALAKKYPFIKGVVAWLDLRAADLDQHLARFSKHPLLKGIRHIAQAEADDFLLQKEVQNGIAQLAAYGLSYDILVYAHQLPAAIGLVAQFPEQAFVLDHLAKPKISKGIDQDWKNHIQQLASYPNVYCKISGMVTETDHFQWGKQDFEPFIDLVLSAFGIDRVMYGSDWPVCLLAAQYQEQLAIVEEYISSLSQTEQSKIMGANAIDFYNL